MTYYDWLKENHPTVLAQFTPQAQERLKEVKYAAGSEGLSFLQKLMAKGSAFYSPSPLGLGADLVYLGVQAENPEVALHEGIHAVQPGLMELMKFYYDTLTPEQRKEVKTTYLGDAPRYEGTTYPRFAGGGTYTRPLGKELYWKLFSPLEAHAKYGEAGALHVPENLRAGYAGQLAFGEAPQLPQWQPAPDWATNQLQNLRPTSLGGMGITPAPITAPTPRPKRKTQRQLRQRTPRPVATSSQPPRPSKLFRRRAR